jgi:hypothetical protein
VTSSTSSRGPGAGRLRSTQQVTSSHPVDDLGVRAPEVVEELGVDASRHDLKRLHEAGTWSVEEGVTVGDVHERGAAQDVDD